MMKQTICGIMIDITMDTIDKKLAGIQSILTKEIKIT